MFPPFMRSSRDGYRQATRRRKKRMMRMKKTARKTQKMKKICKTWMR